MTPHFTPKVQKNRVVVANDEVNSVMNEKKTAMNHLCHQRLS